ncbi:MAG TPA: MlaD family protein [Candidatus Binataceae bacterium]|nr:MlaD family protein [Candidatus Binataceae bacterium]
MVDEHTPLPPVPSARAVVKKRARVSLVWIIPIVAAVVGAWVAVTRYMSEGPKITIIFSSAEGLEPGKTKIHYKGVDVGTITAIRLSEDHQRVVATAEMAPRTEDFLVEDTQLWVVRPRISGANITGLGTLISGAFIGMRIGSSQEEKREFIALDAPPVVSGDVAGRFFALKTGDLGSLDTGTPIFFRRLQVGQIASYQLSKDGRYFTIEIFVQTPYDQYVTPNTRFWQASGVDMQISAGGLKIETQSVLSILIGGVAFETPANGAVLPPAEPNTLFTLYNTRGEAYEPPPHNPQTYQLIFKESVRGLEPGAPVDLRGIRIGEVTEVRAQFDATNFEFSTPVTISVDPQRLGVKITDLRLGENLETIRRKLIDALVSRGLRAQLRTGNLLTGATFVGLDFFPDAKKAQVQWSQNPPELPTVKGQIEKTEDELSDVIKKLDQMPLKEIGDNLQKSLGDLDETLVTARGTLSNANKIVAPDSVQGQELDNALQEVSRAAQSLRVLADYLERHPDALIRGKTGDAK